MADSIRIDNIDNKGGTINFIVNDEEKSSKKNSHSISIAAVDRYSSPLQCNVGLSPWGETHFRVAATVKYELLGQTMYQKYLTYDSEEKAREVMDFIVSVFNEVKDDAEVRLVHSYGLVPKIFKKLSNLSEDAVFGHYESDDASLSKRFNNLYLDTPGDAEPQGWVGKSLPPHFPTHGKGVSKTISEIVGVPTQLANESSSGLVKCANSNMNSKLVLSNSIKKMIDCFVRN